MHTSADTLHRRAGPEVPTRTIIVDNHPLIVCGVKALFSDETDIEVVASAGDFDEGLAAMVRHRPDIAIVDVHMPGKNGLDLVAAARSSHPATRFVLIADRMSHAQFLRAMELDVKGIVLKGMPLHLMVRCVRMVRDGRTFIEKDMVLRAFSWMFGRSAGRVAAVELLSPREMAVAQFAAAGLSNKQVAKSLSLSEGTVKAHLHRVYGKIGVRGRVDLVNYLTQSQQRTVPAAA